MVINSYHGIQADEVTNVTNIEQLGIIIRYLENGKPKQSVIEFIDSQSITGASIYTKIIHNFFPL